MACPVRKEIINVKRKKENETFATKVASSGRPSLAHNDKNGLMGQLLQSANEFDMSKIIQTSAICVVVAALKETEQEGCFSNVLNELLQNNGLSKFNMGQIAPPILRTENKQDEIVSIEPEQNETSKTSSPQQTKSDDRSVVYRKKGGPKITADNLEILVSERKVIVESHLAIDDVVQLMKADVNVIKVIDMPVTKFNMKVNTSFNKRINDGPITRAALGITDQI